MPRDRRLDIPGGVYHIITRGIEQRKIFIDDIDRQEFIKRFEEGLKKTGCKCYGWALIPNHFHLIVCTGVKSLSELMRSLLTGYAIYFNHRHKRKGYLYQNRYKSILCQKDIYLLELVRYVHLNPLRAGIIKDFKSLGSYPWSGHSVILGAVEREWQDTKEILGYFARKRSAAIEKYLEFVKNGINRGKREDLIGGGLKRSAGGWQGIWELKRSKEYWRGDERVLGEGCFVEDVLKLAEEEIEKKTKLQMDGWNLDRLANRIKEIFSVEIEDIRQKVRSKYKSDAKSVFIYWGIKEIGLSAKEIGKYLHCTRSGLMQLVKKGEKYVKNNNIILLS